MDTVVAIVGAGHLPGIQAHWDAEIDIERITALPAERAAQRSRWRWRRLALLAAGSMVLGSAVVRYRGRRS
jgi:pheromone shutdown protein TraB